MQAAATSGLVSEASANSVSGPTGSSPPRTRTPCVALGDEAAGVDDHGGRARHEAVGDPAVDRCERVLHTRSP